MACHTILVSRAPTTTTTTMAITTAAATPFHRSSTFVSFQTRPMKPLLRSTLKTRAVITEDYSITKSVADMSLYDLLGISETVTLPEIKQAYKQLARVYHPDVSPPDRVKEHTDRFIQIRQAYETLSDPNSRAHYDFDLSCGLIHLASSPRNNVQQPCNDEVKMNWRCRCQSQVSELRQRSMNKDSRRNVSWAARIRRQNNQHS